MYIPLIRHLKDTHFPDIQTQGFAPEPFEPLVLVEKKHEGIVSPVRLDVIQRQNFFSASVNCPMSMGLVTWAFIPASRASFRSSS